MSIASELEHLAQNLANANEAIVEKGGTASTTGLSGLADAITGTPSGGGGTPYGKIWYSTTSRDVYLPIMSEGLNVLKFDVGKFNDLQIIKDYISSVGQIYIDFDGGSTYKLTTMDADISTTNPWSDWGIQLEVVWDSSGMGMYHMDLNRFKVADPAHLQEMTLEASDVSDNKIGGGSSLNRWPGTGKTIQLANGSVQSNLIYKIELGNAISTIPQSFCTTMMLMDADFSYCSATTVGNSAFGYTSESSFPGYAKPSMLNFTSVGTGAFNKPTFLKPMEVYDTYTEE